MSHTVVRVEGLSKQYMVGASGAKSSYRTVREAISEAVAAPLRNLKFLQGHAPERQIFWALNDVSFEIAQGEVTGIIGANGAGKSTLMKLLSRITEPTRGRISIRGRVASLLEVGTGFHPELTGRENIMLNGAVLGMKRNEILRKFDEIVNFAGVEKFVDTPVKRYSSGMYLRLAFAVAAHLEPEILMVDEVLAVGDMAFQQRCMGRMREVSQEGRTVLLVSHNMAAIESLCRRCLLLDAGRLVQAGNVKEVTREYRRRVNGDQGGAVSLQERSGASREKKRSVFTSVTVVDEYGEPTTALPVGGNLHVRVGLDLPEALPYVQVVVRFEDGYGQRMLTVRNLATDATFYRLGGQTVVECCVPRFPLNRGEYWISLALYTREQGVDYVDKALSLTVVDGDAFGDGKGSPMGICIAASDWRVVDDTAGGDNRQ